MKKILLITFLSILGLFANDMPLKDDKNKIHNLHKTIYFSRGAKSINSEQDKKLQKHAKFLKNTKDVKLLLEGFTDNVGNREQNHWIALDYAKACKERLVKMGIDASRISITTYGSSKSKEAQIRDRKVEFIYYY